MFLFVLLVGIIFFAWYFISGNSSKRKVPLAALVIDSALLDTNVLFYQQLDSENKKQFESDINVFLQDVRITGVDTRVELLDKLLVASAAVIPIFYFKNWKYYNLQEVLLYSDAINLNFESKGSEGRNILGMVGTGSLEGKLLLSQLALRQGFLNKTDKSNTAIHEFVHLIDKADGDTDGIPHLLLDKQFVLPWMNLIQEKIQQIAKLKSDINPYATMNKAEFLAVSTEYFFERPGLLKVKHPQLYAMLQEMFDFPGQQGSVHA
ncbi:MAG: zinc-dependent peptidase [Ferruginibacter sp.]